MSCTINQTKKNVLVSLIRLECRVQQQVQRPTFNTIHPTSILECSMSRVHQTCTKYCRHHFTRPSLPASRSQLHLYHHFISQTLSVPLVSPFSPYFLLVISFLQTLSAPPCPGTTIKQTISQGLPCRRCK